MEKSTTQLPVETTVQPNAPISWSGTFPQHYDDNLGPFIFRPYALDLVSRIDTAGLQTVLELACGTGQVTQPLLDHLPASTHLTATDLSPDMMTVAKGKISAPNVQWAQVDMTAIPFDDNTFDLIVCQFGVMFAPDKAKAFSEMYRVLKPGGRLLFNTWGAIPHNRVFQVFNQVMIRLMDTNIGAAAQGPFSMPDEEPVLTLMEAAGFHNRRAESVAMVSEATSAAQAAKGFFQGSVISVTLKEKNPAMASTIQAEIEQAFRQELGDTPMRTPLQAWIFSATK